MTRRKLTDLEAALALRLYWAVPHRDKRYGAWSRLTGKSERAFYRRLRDGLGRRVELAARWPDVLSAAHQFDEEMVSRERAEVERLAELYRRAWEGVLAARRG